MKNNLKLILTLIAAAVAFFTIYYVTEQDETKYTEDEIKFIEDYSHVDLPEDNNAVYATYEEMFDVFDNKESAIFYLGATDCPWCAHALPSFVDAITEYSGIEFLYMPIRADRNELSLVDGEIVTVNHGLEEYNTLVEYLYDYLPSYGGLEDDTIKRIYMPTFVFIKDGVVEYLHMSTVPSHNDSTKDLTEEQYEELKSIFLEKVETTFPQMCDTAC